MFIKNNGDAIRTEAKLFLIQENVNAVDGYSHIKKISLRIK